MESEICKKKRQKNLFVDIILYVVGIILILLTICGIIIRATNNNNFYLFGYRFDVVLTDSMSSKNEEHLDFLEGHDDQIQAFDLVVSKKVESEKEIDVYDIVLFDNPSIGLDMHRIVGKSIISSTQITATKSEYKTLDLYEGICLSDYESALVSNGISLKEISLVTYSKNVGEENCLNFSILDELLEPNITRELSEGGLLTTYKISRSITTPGALVINHQNKYDFGNELIVSCVVTLHDEAEPITLEKSHLVAIGDDLISSSNVKFEYEIRGDKAKTSDGTFKANSIHSKVTACVPKIGYLVRYLTSVWGIAMFVLLGVLVLTSDILLNKFRRQEEALVEKKEGEVKEDENEKKNNT